MHDASLCCLNAPHPHSSCLHAFPPACLPACLPAFPSPLHACSPQIGLYFAFIGHYCSWLLAPAVFGFGVYIDMASESSYNVRTQFWFGTFLAFWSTFMLEFWKVSDSATYS